MGLHFLKYYASFDKSASDFHWDIQTYRKWSWYMVEAIARLDQTVVSILYVVHSSVVDLQYLSNYKIGIISNMI